MESEFGVQEREPNQKTEVVLFAPQGMGFGEGAISVKTQLERGELQRESLDAAIEIILTEDDVFTAVDSEANDDGCGDGRGTKGIYKVIDAVTGTVQTFKRSLRRAKLFGGGLVAAASMWRAVDGAPGDSKSLKGDRDFIASELTARGISYGAHTDDHATGDNCGCGAIDKYPAISRNVTLFEDPIMQNVKALYGDAFDQNLGAVEKVMQLYADLDDRYFAGVTGRSTMQDIEAGGAVVKQLQGDHMEDLVVINTVKGTTLDQDALRSKLIERGLSPNIQAFVVDEWRGREYAETIADIASKIGKDYDESYAIAYADFLIRTLAVSGTLTAGDQPVLLRRAV